MRARGLWLVAVAVVLVLGGCRDRAGGEVALPAETALAAQNMPATGVAVTLTATAVMPTFVPTQTSVPPASSATEPPIETAIPATLSSATETATAVVVATEAPVATALPAPEDVAYTTEVVATNLSVPWALSFDDAGALYFTERPGRLRVIRDGVLEPEPVAELPVAATGEGGLLGLALDPQFSTNGQLYLMYTLEQGGGLANRIARYTLGADGLSNEVVLVDGIPGARNHDGGRLAFGPDGMLYATTGDAGRPALAQDMDSLAGKILRMSPDGSVPADNPFTGSLVYSYGHRNPQGLAWHPETGVLYSVEHGPSGEFGSCCRDELNRIIPGGNYGWPYVAGNDVLDAAGAAGLDLIAPVASSGEDTWAPASLAFYRGEPLASWENMAFVGMLRGSDVMRVELGGAAFDQVVASAELLNGEFQRIREVIVGPDGYLYISTSNQDGRAWPAPEDDCILRIVPAP